MAGSDVRPRALVLPDRWKTWEEGTMRQQDQWDRYERIIKFAAAAARVLAELAKIFRGFGLH